MNKITKIIAIVAVLPTIADSVLRNIGYANYLRFIVQKAFTNFGTSKDNLTYDLVAGK